MALKKPALQTLSGVAAIGLTLGVAAPANAMLSDNVHNQAGGGVNIHADNTCVEKVGDTAHVKFMAQHQPLTTSSDHGQTAAHGTLALPREMKNVSIKLKAVGGGVTVTNTNTGDVEDMFREATVFDTPLEIPILENSDEYREKFPYGPPTLGGLQEIKGGEKKWEYDKESVPSVKETPDPDNPDLVHESDLWTEQEVRDFVEKYDVHVKKTPQGFMDANLATVPFMAFGSGDVAWYGTKYSKDYDLYEFGNVLMPVTFEIEGDVPVEQEDTFVTGAISNLGWKSSTESYAGNYEMGSQSLQEYQWGRPNQLPPAIPKSEDMIQLYKDKLSDAGLDISPTIAPTREMPGDSKYKYIGSDIRPSARGDVGLKYSQTFTLHSNPAVWYVGQADTSGEDGADITAAHVTLCPANDTPETETPETETPETETPETETPETETPETETPETETPETETPETETPETETPETETPETDTPETETPETETPETETPNTDTPETDVPETETPNADTPETETPETDTPNTDTPETDTPAPAPSNDGDTGSRTLASTGASVIGIGVVALVLIGAGIFLSRRKKD